MSILDTIRSEPRPAPSTSDRADVAIIGGGASGVLLAAELLRHGRRVRRVALIERTAHTGRGAAYGTGDPAHLLNVPAGGMSAMAHDATHFVRWLRRRNPDAHELTFAARRDYRRYLGHVLADARELGDGELLRRNDAATGIDPDPRGMRVRLAGGGHVLASEVVLATGTLPPVWPQIPGLDAVPSARVVGDPWRPGALDALPDGPVLCLGTGLTAIDVALTLSRDQRRSVLALSRHGLLPSAHRADGPRDPYSLELPDDVTAPGLLRWLRSEIAALAAEGKDWREAVNAIRPHSPRLWAAMTLAERERFHRHLERYWTVSRQRMAPQVAAAIDRLRADGRLEISAGSVRRVTAAPDGLHVLTAARSGARSERIAAIVNCTGPGRDVRADPLLGDLCRRGIVLSHPLGGLAASADGLTATGLADRPPVWAIGSLLTGERLESVAVPEIRTQAWLLARRLGRHAATGAAAARHG